MAKYTLFDKAVWNLFLRPGEVVEVRIPKVWGKSPAWGNDFAKGTVSGYFDDHEAFCKAAREADKFKHGGNYFSLQSIDPRLIARAFNRLKPSNLTTSDHNVFKYRWIPIDIDPVRPAGISASDRELELAMAMRKKVTQFCFEDLGLPQPLTGMSGNGGHLLFMLPDIKANDQSRSFVENFLQFLADKFNTDHVNIDTTVFNPARIWKLYGTTARKGDPVPAGPGREARPHRIAFIDSEIEGIRAIDRAKLAKLYNMVTPEKPKEHGGSTRSTGNGSNGGKLDVAKYLDHYGIPFKIKSKNGVCLYCLDHCLFDESHVREASVIQQESGRLLYQCFHNSCQGRTWKDARQIMSGNDNLGPFMAGQDQQNGDRKHEQKRERASVSFA